MAQQVGMLAAKLDNLISIYGTHTLRGSNITPPQLSSDLHRQAVAHTHVHTNTLNKQTFFKNPTT